MGAAHSTEPRSVSMENPSGVIDVSDEVVQRLKRGIKQKAKENAIAKPETTQEDEGGKQKPSPAQQVVYQAPQTIYIGGTTLTAADVMRQKQAELKENDEMWRKRLAQLEQTLKKTNTIMESEYTAAVEDVRKRFATASSTRQLPPCQDLKAKVIECYRANPGQTLKCADEVELFRNCINLHRVKKLEEAEEKEAKSLASTPATKAAKAA